MRAPTNQLTASKCCCLMPQTAEANSQLRADIAASFQRVAVAHLEERCRRAVAWVQESHPQVRMASCC